MRTTVLACAAATLLMSSLACAPALAEVGVGRPAPDFALPDQNGKIHRLSDYRGKIVILAFYPKDMTPG